MKQSSSKRVLSAMLCCFVLGVADGSFEPSPVSLNSGISSISWGGTPKPKDCADLRQHYTENGVYTVFIGVRQKPVQVYCDLETNGGGWLVFQRREDGFQNFLRPWNDYAEGFGDLHGEFWLGNHVLHLLTNQKNYSLRVDMADFTNLTRYAAYANFQIDAPFKKYRLEVSGFNGDAGDALAPQNGQPFSTYDQDNDAYGGNCAQEFKGAWWYAACHSSNLNGFYYGGPHSSYADGVDWRKWSGYAQYSLRFTQLKIRPADFVENNQD